MSIALSLISRPLLLEYTVHQTLNSLFVEVGLACETIPAHGQAFSRVVV